MVETLSVSGRALRYVQVEANFSQPNAGIAEQMLGWAVDATRPAGGAPARDLLELYCGNGNFTVAVAPNFRRVVATELSKASVAAAKRNCELNGAENVFLARMRAEEFTEAWRGGRKLERLKDLDLEACDFQTLLVDPPRAGLDPDTLQLLRSFDNVVYVSCNPGRSLNAWSDVVHAWWARSPAWTSKCLRPNTITLVATTAIPRRDAAQQFGGCAGRL